MRLGVFRTFLLATCGLAALAQPSPVWRRLLPPGVHLLPAREVRNTYSVLVSVPIPGEQKMAGDVFENSREIRS